MSNYLVHFSKSYGGKNAYDNIISILSNRRLEARTPFGAGRQKAPNPESQNAVCFSEVPLHLLGRLVEARSEYGIVFKKNTVRQQGGNPILYAYKDGAVAKSIRKLVSAASNDAMHPIWEIAPFVDAPGVYPSGAYFFEWEREWRKVGNFIFNEEDVAFLVIPEALHAVAESFFEDARRENLGPYYGCPFIDGHWDIEKVKPLLSYSPTLAD
ncbi:abortive infection system antitoxin AbiGi family protein [Parvibaculum sp.]|uniref:abortive infection system antitoxin AbiGi family protein n=1 Tax=Parvibaculum sp. TaxID=2024848 RepID=UPI0025DCE000|nr:abortive infection system antitoxin AbiGi family protein [Parvibaculum sp.]